MGEEIKSYKDLIVWKKAVQLAREVYTLTEKFPQSELYGLTNQMRRCAVSIASNIAEGRRKGTKKEFRQFIAIAFGSGLELETQIEISKSLPFGANIDYNNAQSLLMEVMKMLNKMLYSLKS